MTGSELLASVTPETLIPSELMMDHIASFIDREMIQVGLGTKTPTELKQDILGVKRFIDTAVGIHAKMAFAETYFMLEELSDDEITKKCQIVVEFLEQKNK